MCEPVTIALAASAVVGIAGALYSGEQQRKAASQAADVADQGAAAAEAKAKYDETLHRERIRKTLSTMRSLYGKSGVDATGSPLLALEDTAAQSELDALAIRYGGKIEASRNRSEADILRMRGETAQTASYFQAGSTLLQAGGDYYKYKEQKDFMKRKS